MSKFTKINSYDVVGSPGFSNAKFVPVEDENEKMKRERKELRELRKKKINKLNLTRNKPLF